LITVNFVKSHSNIHNFHLSGFIWVLLVSAYHDDHFVSCVAEFLFLGFLNHNLLDILAIFVLGSKLMSVNTSHAL